MGRLAYPEEEDCSPAALGNATDRGYDGLARGYQAAIAAFEIPGEPSKEKEAALYHLHDLALNLAVLAYEAHDEDRAAAPLSEGMQQALRRMS